MGTNIFGESERKREQREFNKNAQRLLTEKDRNYLHSVLQEFNSYRSVDNLILSLKSCLDTPEKLDLLKDIRTLIPPQQLNRFDSLAPYHKMAHPSTFPKEPYEPSNNNDRNGFIMNGNDTSSVDSKTSFRIVSLNKADAAPSGTMGFSIRGGRELNMGIYVSKVDDNSLAQKQGLCEGDQIIEVNGVSFEHIANASAVNFLSSLDKMKFVVKSTGKRFSVDKGSTFMENSYTTWVDKDGKPIMNGDDLNSNSTRSDSMTNGLTLRHDQWHLSDADERRVNFTVEFTPSGFIGFNIRGGAEYGLGIYVSGVDMGSVVEDAGIQVGDQILDVNGRNFENIRHQDAVDFIRAQKHIMMTVKAVGKLPEAKHFFSELSWIHPDGTITRESKYHGSQSISPPVSPRLDMSDSAVQFPDSAPLTSSSSSVQTSEPFIRPPSVDNTTQTVEPDPEPVVEIQTIPFTSTPNPSPLKEPDIEMVVMTTEDTVDAKPDMQDIQGDNAKGYDTKSVESRTSSASSGTDKKGETTKRSSLDSLGDPEYSEVIPKSHEEKNKKKRSKSFLSKQGDKIRAKLSFRKRAKPKVEDRRGQDPDEMRATIAKKAKQTLSVDEFNAFLRIMKDYQNDGNVEGMTKRLLDILDQPNKAILLSNIRSIVHPHDLGRFNTMVRDKEIEILAWINATNPSASPLFEGDGKPQRRQRIAPVVDSKGNFSLRTESEAASYQEEREKLVKQKGQIFSQKSTLLDREHRRASTVVTTPPGQPLVSLPVQTVTPLPPVSSTLDTIPVRDTDPVVVVTEAVPAITTPSTSAIPAKPKPQPPPPYKPPVIPTLTVPSIQVNDSPEIIIEEPIQKLDEQTVQASQGSFLAVPDRVAAEYKDEEDVQSSDFAFPVNTGVVTMESTSSLGDPFAPQMLTVNLSKQRTSMGISISGGKGSRSQPEIRVEKVFPGGAAYDNGMLQSGYEIVSIDGLSLQGVSHAEAVDIIRKAYNDKTKSVMEIIVIP